MNEGSYHYMIHQSWAGPDRTVVHDHFQRGADKTGTNPGAWALALSGQVVIPLRDPLAACLTAQQRADTVRDKGYNALDCLAEWELLCEVWPSINDKAVWIPWDLIKSAKQISELARQLNLRSDGRGWFSRSPVYNSKGEYHYKKLYREGNWKELSKLLPEMAERLARMEPSLRAILEPVGYCELIWWS
jgi:hypothetical protein